MYIMTKKCEPLKIYEDGGGYQCCEPAEATHIRLHMPGPLPNRILPVIIRGSRKETGCWSWNGDIYSPTIKPSILTKTAYGDKELICHSWINDGVVIFLDDCTHELAGQKVALLDID